MFQVVVNEEVVAEFGSGELSAAREKAIETGGRVKVQRR